MKSILYDIFAIGKIRVSIIIGVIVAVLLICLLGYLWGIAFFAILAFVLLRICSRDFASKDVNLFIVSIYLHISMVANIFMVVLILLSKIYPLFLIEIIFGFCWYLGFQKYKEEYLKEKEKEKEKEEKRFSERMAINYERRKRVEEEDRKRLNDLIYRFQQLTKGYLLIDNNIWMNKDYDVLFEKLITYSKINNTQILFLGIQHNELTKLKYSKEKKLALLARLAFCRIEKFQEYGILKSIGMELVASSNSYADPYFIQFFIEAAKWSEAGKLSCEPIFITDDRELRIRLKACLAERGRKEPLIYTGKELTEVAVAINSWSPTTS